ncbi:hypothetical protein [Nocardioides lijunqiniae]|uniref:hypothetical protein n=1 Tax=Nocardioides lijunqiniae TaxID=2760832 RepID=UPI001D0BFB55|nr:hypothetical protein [Nocardioides lijunqiniae]
MQTDVAEPGTPGAPTRLRAMWVGLAVAVGLVVAAVVARPVFGWEVYAYAHPGPDDAAPLHARWEPRVGPGTVPAVLLALLGWRYAVRAAERLRWRHLLVVSYAAGLAWLLSLALVDGIDGVSSILAHSYEYLETARATSDFPAALREWIGRIPLDSEDNWPVHVAGHPPGALLFFVVLDRLGLGGAGVAGLVVTLVAASVPAAVLTTLRTLREEAAARRAAPFLVLGPAALWMCVSGDAVFTAVAAWGLAALAAAATRTTWRGSAPWAVLAGVLLGSCVMMSYGLPLLGVLALAVLAAARSWRPLPVAAAAASVVVLAFAVEGYALWEAYPVLRERYWDGVASDRPTAYWIWANLAVLVLSAGPVLGAGLGQTWARRGELGRPVLLLVGAAVASIALADLSLMSKAEVERIWLPFVPWLLVATSALPQRWRRSALGLQLVAALVLQHLVHTSW